MVGTVGSADHSLDQSQKQFTRDHSHEAEKVTAVIEVDHSISNIAKSGKNKS